MSKQKPFLDKATDIGVTVAKFVYVDTTKAGFRAGRGRKRAR